MSGADPDATLSTATDLESSGTAVDGIRYVPYGDEKESPYLPAIRQLISKDLSEPYSIYVYRYFLYQWPDLCFMVGCLPTTLSVVMSDTFEQALDDSDNLIGVIVCKLEPHRGGPMRGYIAMLATREEHRGKGIASRLVRMAVQKMIEKDADEVSLLLAYAENHPELMLLRSLWRRK